MLYVVSGSVHRAPAGLALCTGLPDRWGELLWLYHFYCTLSVFRIDTQCPVLGDHHASVLEEEVRREQNQPLPLCYLPFLYIFTKISVSLPV